MARPFDRRRFLHVLGGGTAAILVSACAGGTPAPASGGGATGGAPAAKAPDKPAEKAAGAAPAAKASGSAIFWFNQPAQQEAFTKILERFNTSQGAVKLDSVLVPANEIPTKLATAIAGGEPPDACRLGGPAANALFITNGHAAALDDWDPQIQSYDWLAGPKRVVTRNGKMHAMPVNSGAQALILHPANYEKAGLDPQKPPATLDQLLEYAGKIATAGGGQLWGHYAQTAPTAQTGSDNFPAILWAYGGKEVSEDGTKVVINSPEAAQALEWYRKLVEVKGVPVKQINEVQMLQDYLTGNVGSMIAFPGILARVAGAGFKSLSTQLPTGPKGRFPPIGFGTIMVLEKAKNRDAGWAFASFIGLQPANGAFWNISFGQLPPRQSFREDPSWKEYEQKTPLVPAFLEAQKTAEIPYFGPGAQEMGTETGKAVEAVVFGQKTPQAALEELAKTNQVILDRERQKLG